MLPAIMIPYRVCSRVIAVTEDLYQVAVTATREDSPREGAIMRLQDCSSRHGAEQIREILENQVATAVVAAGGRVVSLESQ
jgi:hypothetical protein